MRRFNVRLRHKMLSLEKLELGGAEGLGRGAGTGVGDRLPWAAPGGRRVGKVGAGAGEGNAICLSI